MTHRVGTPLNPNFGPVRGSATLASGLKLDSQHVETTRRVYYDRDGHRRRAGFISPFYVAFPYALPYDTDTLDDGTEQAQQAPLPPEPPQPFESQAPAQLSDLHEGGAGLSSVSTRTPTPDIGEFILIRRDGQVTLAVAFTTSADQLTYINREGARRSFPSAELDREATREMNDARGTTLPLPQ